MPSIDFSELTDEQAQAAFEAYVAAADDRLAWLRDEVAASGGRADKLDFSPESLVPLWEWFLRWLEGDGPERQVDELPLWYVPDPPALASERLSPATLLAVDALGYYLAECFLRAVPGMHWAIGKEPKRLQYVDQNKPVLKGLGIDVNPLGIVYAQAVRVARFGEDLPADRLLELFRNWTERREVG